MPPSSRFAVVAPLLIIVMGAVSSASAADAVKLLPAETEMVLTINLRGFLNDHGNTEVVQRYLEQWRLAFKGDEKQLRKYYQAHELRQTEGVSEQEFLDRANRIKSIGDALGVNLLEDVDRLTCGFKKKERGFFIVIVEGRFKEETFKAGVKKLAREYFGSVRLTRLGGLDLWQTPEDGAAVNLVLLNDKTLAITDSKKTMEGVLALAGGEKKGGLSGPVRTLFDSGKKEHVALVVSNVGDFLDDGVTFLKGKVVQSLGPDDAVGKLVVGQAATEIRKFARDASSVSIGFSPREDELRLQFGLDARKPATVKELAALLDRGNFWGALALKAIDNELTRSLADVVLRQRVVVKDATLVMHTTVPYEFIQQLLQGPLLVLLSPEFAGAKAAPLPGQAFLAELADRATSIPLWGLPDPRPPGAFDVKEVRAVAYRDGPTADPYRNRLDLFLPRNKKDFPVVVLVHGGSWAVGDNRCAGLYSSVGQFLASQGVGVVLPNYRLSPAVKHPEHVKDVARAAAWTRDNVGKYGGDPRRIYLMGHSAGGHLVALLATDESYLKAEGMKATDFKGVVAVSGVYRVPQGQLATALGGSGPRAVRLEQLIPLRGESGPFVKFPLPGYPVHLNLFAPVFGDNGKDCANASPLTHVRRGLPPFLILSAEYDLPLLAGMAEEFHAALRREGCDARLLKMAKRNHNSLLFSMIAPEDPAARAILEFIRK
jgi:acetyl esterase/lipase